MGTLNKTNSPQQYTETLSSHWIFSDGRPSATKWQMVTVLLTDEGMSHTLARP